MTWIPHCRSAVRRLAKELRGGLIYHSGLFGARLRRLGRDHALVLTYHRILPRDEATLVEPGMFVEPATFETHLQFVRRHFAPRSLDEFLALLDGPPAPPLAPPTVLVTFDDGWVDCYRHAFPLLQRYEVPATVFLPTAYIGSDRRFWSERLAALFRAVPEGGGRQELMAFLERRLGGAIGAVGEGLTDLIARLKRWPQPILDTLLAAAEERFGLRREERDFLDWEEIAAMRRSGLVSFGAHGDSHRPLTSLADAERDRELALCRAQLTRHDCGAGAEPAFCYPNGDFDAAATEQVRRHHYSCAFTTRRGWVGPETSRFALVRVGLHQDVSSSPALLADRLYFSAAG